MIEHAALNQQSLQMLEVAAAAEIISVLGPSAGPTLGRAAGSVVGKRLGKIVEERATKNKAEQACAEAFQEWLVALMKDFKECGTEEDDLQRFFRTTSRRLKLISRMNKRVPNFFAPHFGRKARGRKG